MKRRESRLSLRLCSALHVCMYRSNCASTLHSSVTRWRRLAMRMLQATCLTGSPPNFRQPVVGVEI